MSSPYIAVSAGSDRKIWKPSHQACADTGKLPRYVMVNRSTALPSAWSGSETFVDIELPSTLGVLDDMIVRFQISTSATGAVAPPTPFWVSRTEEYIGSDLLATTYANDQFNEVVGFASPQKLDVLNEALNITLTGTGQVGSGTLGNGSQYFYLPLYGCAFSSMKPYVKGFQAKLRVRLYFPSSILTATNPNSATITLNDITLIAREVVTPQDDVLARIHASGVVDYNCVVKERQVEAVTLTAGTDTTVFLRSFKNNSAGILTYVTDQFPANAALIVRQAVDTLQLQDAVGNKISDPLRQEFIRAFGWTDAVDSAYPAAAASQYVNVIPFSSNFQKSAETGCELGTFPFSTLEKLVVRPDAGVTGSKTLTITSYSHFHVVVSGGKHYIQPVSTASR